LNILCKVSEGIAMTSLFNSHSKRRNWLGCLGRGLIGLLVFLAILLVSGAVYQTVASSNDLKRYPPPGRLIDMGGYKLHIYCTGEHQANLPTVILEAGSGSASPDWQLVQPEIARMTRVCSYDRAGYGWSDSGPLPRTSQRFAEELHTLLIRAGEQEPYLLVGHSLGGHTVRLFANQHPQEVMGVVLVDARPEELAYLVPDTNKPQMSFWAFMARCGFFRLFGKAVLVPPIFLEKMPDYPWPILFRPKFFETTRDEDAIESDKQVQSAGNLGDLPLIVITHGAIMFAYLSADEALQAEQAWQAAQKQLASLSSNGQFIIADGSGHAIPVERPDIVIEAIKQLLKPTP
jgi:pimeloyl-ACP methyl ester carboxylesterase